MAIKVFTHTIYSTCSCKHVWTHLRIQCVLHARLVYTHVPLSAHVLLLFSLWCYIFYTLPPNQLYSVWQSHWAGKLLNEPPTFHHSKFEMRLDIQMRKRVVRLKEEGYTYKEIQEHLAEEGIRVTITTLYLFGKLLIVSNRSHGPCNRLLTKEHHHSIDQRLLENDELTTRSLRQLLVSTFLTLQVSSKTFGRVRQNLGWVIHHLSTQPVD